MSDLTVGQRLLVTEATQSALPDGYNWLGSAPIVDGTTPTGDIICHQYGYPYRFTISQQDALQMRAAYLHHATGGATDGRQAE